MLRIYLIRHAQSANNALSDQTLRHHDPGLTELGCEQARLLAQHLANGDSRDMQVDIRSGYSVREDGVGFGITRLYTSAMQRALLTSAEIARATGLQPHVWLDIHEEGGVYLDQEGGRIGKPGMNRSQIADQFPSFGLPDPMGDEGWWGEARGYETRELAYERARRVAAELRSHSESDETIALITHGTFIDRLIKALFDQTEIGRSFYLHYNAAITRLDFFAPERLLIRYLNRIDHLPHDMMS